MVIRVCLLLLIAVAWVPVRGAGDKDVAKTDLKEIKSLIHQLGSDRFELRAKAEKRLAELGETALDALQDAAANAEDLEVRRRAGKLADAVLARKDDNAWQKIVKEFQANPLEQLAPTLAKDPVAAPQETWKLITRMVELAEKRAAEVGGRPFPMPKFELDKLRIQRGLQSGPVNARSVFNGEQAKAAIVAKCIVVSNGNLPRMEEIHDSWLIVNGDFEGCRFLDHCFVLCRGNVGRILLMQDCIMLAGGDMLEVTGIETSYIEAKAVNRLSTSRQNVFVNLPANPATRSQDDQVVATKNPVHGLFRAAATSKK